jgi:hypothetical protein
MLTEFQAEFLVSTLNITMTTFSILYESDNSAIMNTAVEKVVTKLIDLIPVVGPLLTASYDIFQITTAREKAKNTASAFLDELDGFLRTAQKWCLSTQFLIDGIIAMDDPVNRTFDVEASIGQLSERYRVIMDKVTLGES